MDLAAVDSQDDVTGVLIAADDLELGAQDRIQGGGKNMHAAANAIRPDNHLLTHEIICVLDRRALADDAQVGVGCRRSQPAELSRVEVRAPVSHDRPCRYQPVQGAELEPVLRRKRVDVIGGLEAAAAGHVLDDDRGRTGNAAAEMRADEPGPDGISAGRSDVGNELDLLAGVKLVLRGRAGEIEQQGGYHDRGGDGFKTSRRSLKSGYYDHSWCPRMQSLLMLPDCFHARKDCIDVRCGIGTGYRACSLRF